MDDRHSDPLIDDALTREIEDALDVEPSPHFAARVIANKPERSARRPWWAFAGAAAAVAVAVVAAVLVLPGRVVRTPAPELKVAIATLPTVTAPAPIVRAAPPETPRVASAPVTKRVAPPVAIVPVVRRAPTKEPEVLFAKDELAALQRLTRGITRGAVDPATLSEPSTTTIVAIQPEAIVVSPLTEISPVAIEPFGSLVEGVRK